MSRVVENERTRFVPSGGRLVDGIASESQRAQDGKEQQQAAFFVAEGTQWVPDIL